MALEIGTIVGAPLVTGDTNNEFGTHYTKLGIGGWRAVETLADRDAISIERREVGMEVKVLEDEKTYELKQPLTNEDWVEVIVSGGDSLPEAPKDGKQYARKNGKWFEVITGSASGGDGNFPEAPVDGRVYGRSNLNWVEVTGGSGSGSGVVFKVKSTTPAGITSPAGSPVNIEYNWTSIDSSDDIPTGTGSVMVTINSATFLNTTTIQGDRTIVIPSNRLISGNNTVVVKVTDSYGNTRSLTYSVQVITLSISSTYNPTDINNGDITFRYTPIGNIEKTIHFEVDGVPLPSVETALTNRQLTYTIPAQTHGTHNLKVYITATIDGSVVSSNELIYDIISVVTGNNTPLISLSLTEVNMDQYETIKIPYIVYTPGNINSTVELSVDGDILNTVVVNRDQQYWNFKANNDGVYILTITSGVAVKSLILNVALSEVDVTAETLNLELYLTSQNRSNSESTKSEWKSGIINASLTGFNYINNGWITDSEGSTVLRVDNGAKVVIPFKPFSKDIKGSGQTIEFEFKSRAISVPNSTLISCMSGTVGFKVDTNAAYFSSEQTRLDTRYKEDERIRVSILITKVADGRLIELYINGVMSSLQQYPSLDSFLQASPANITIGSDNAGIDLYNIRVYDNNLNQYQLLNNFIADLDRVDEKVRVYRHNDIYDDFGNLDYAKANEFLPCLTIIGVLPEFKGDKVNRSFEYSDIQNPEKSFTANGQIDVQGTSSQYYPRKNWKIKFGAFTGLDSIVIPKYKLRSNSIPENTFTMKADFAESSGTHNTGLAKLFDNALKGLGFLTPVQVGNPDIRTTVDGFPILIFHKLTADSPRVFTGKYNFNNDKTDATFGFTGVEIQSWETKNNTSDLVLFKDDDFTSLDSNGKLNWLNDYEARYPDKFEDSTKLQSLVTWIKSTDGNPTKFKAEYQQYFNKNFLLFYYVMTELFAMVDQRGKNQFLTVFPTDLGDRWYHIFYDNDTVLGINNEGAIQFGYDVEYHDIVGSGFAFNAESSVLFNNIELSLQDEIETLYKRIRSEGIITYPKMLKYLNVDQSDLWSESIYNEDSKFKYLDPLLEDGNGAYLYAAQGSREEHRKWWLYNRIAYMDSKYQAASNRTDFVSMRLYTPSIWGGVAPNADLYLTPFSKGYATAKYGSYIFKKRLVPGIVNVITAPAITFNDTETIIYGASLLSSLGDLSSKYIGTLDVSKAIHLTELIVGSTVAGYSNLNLTTLSLGNNTLLKKLNIANTPDLIQSIDLTGCTSIDEIEATGSGITSIELPTVGNLSRLSLPGVTSLVLRNQSKLTNITLTLDTYGNLTTLILENCPLLNPFTVLEQANSLTALRITGLDGTSPGVEGFGKALTVGGVNAFGVATPFSVLEGKWHFDTISSAELNAFQANWENLTITYTNLANNIVSTMNSPEMLQFPANPDFLLTSSVDFNIAVKFGTETVYADLVADVMKVVKPTIGSVFNNTPVTIYGGSLLKNLGNNLPRKYFGSLDISLANKFTELILGDNNPIYNNTFFTSLNLGSSTALTKLNIAGTPNMQRVLDLSGIPNLKQLEAKRSGIKEVILAPTSKVTKLELPAIEVLKLKNQTLLTASELTLEDVTKLKNLILEGTPSISTKTLLETAINLERVRATNLTGTSANAGMFNRLAGLTGYDANGVEQLKSYLSGTWTFEKLMSEEKALFESQWVNLVLTVIKISDDIEFLNAAIGAALVAKFDTNGSGGLSLTEIRAILSLDGALKNITGYPIQFPEFVEFTGITSINANDMPTDGIFGELTLPSSVTRIENNARIKTPKLNNYSQLTYVGTQGFYTELNNQEVLTLPNLQFLGTQGFYENAAQGVDLTGASITNIPNNGFRFRDTNHNYSRVKQIVLNEGLVSISDYGFYNSSNITTLVGSTPFPLVFPSSMRSIGADAFGNHNISSITLNEGLLTIGSNVFGGTFTEITIPSTVTSIVGYGAFRTPNGITKVTILSDVPFEIDRPFNSNTGNPNPNLKIYVPAGKEAIYKATSGWSYYKNYIQLPPPVDIVFADAQVKAYLVSLYDTNADGEIDTNEASNLTLFSKPPSSQSAFYDTNNPLVGDWSFEELHYFKGLNNYTYMFYNNRNLLNVGTEVFGNNVTNAYGMFSQCKKLEFAPKLPDTITNMLETFNSCGKITNKVYIPNSVTNMYATFRYCYLLTEIDTIPNGVTNMESTFAYCSELIDNNIIIPSTVINMERTFDGCTKLTQVTILATTPPTYNNTLNNTTNLTSIYVPDSAVAAFKSASGWSNVSSKIKPLSSKP